MGTLLGARLRSLGASLIWEGLGQPTLITLLLLLGFEIHQTFSFHLLFQYATGFLPDNLPFMPARPLSAWIQGSSLSRISLTGLYIFDFSIPPLFFLFISYRPLLLFWMDTL